MSIWNRKQNNISGVFISAFKNPTDFFEVPNYSIWAKEDQSMYEAMLSENNIRLNACFTSKDEAIRACGGTAVKDGVYRTGIC